MLSLFETNQMLKYILNKEERGPYQHDVLTFNKYEINLPNQI